MNAWVFAGGLFVVVLGFEVLMFRYVGRNRASGTGTERTGTTSPGTDGRDAAGTGTGTGTAVGDASDARDATTCRECGRRNDDAPTVQYCWNCLARLR